MSSRNILFVNDEQQTGRRVKKSLKKIGLEVTCRQNANKALNLLQNTQLSETRYSLVLLYFSLQENSGLELIQSIRQTSTVPIIVLSSRTDVEDKITALEIGADDYLTTPYDDGELIARIQSVLRRTINFANTDSNSSQITFAGWRLNLLSQTLVSPKGKTVDITSTEYRLLKKLLNRSNKTIQREEILSLLSDREWSPFDRSADMAISKLRKKIEVNPRKPEIIKTIRNHGYKLTAAIQFDTSI